MQRLGVHLCLAAACLLTTGYGHAAKVASDENRRYLNQVFDEHVRTADVVFAENTNNTTGKKEKLTMRVFEPKGDSATQRALFVLTPGGGFVRHEDHWMDAFGEELARAGYVVAINRYRLSEDLDSTEKYMDALFKAFSDQKAAIRYFVKDAQGKNRFKIDPNNIFIGGHSAGGITSMHVAYLDEKDRLTKAMSTAMMNNGGIKGNSGNEEIPFSIRGVINMSGLVTQLDIIDAGEPPLMSLHGDQDKVVAIGTEDGRHGSIPIHKYAEQVGLKNELHVIRGALHNDTSDPHLCPECVPLSKRFMYNQIFHDDSTTGQKQK